MTPYEEISSSYWNPMFHLCYCFFISERDNTTSDLLKLFSLGEGSDMKKVLISSLLIILLDACGPTRDQLLLTVTVEEKTAEAMRVGAFQTQTAEPSRTSPQAVASMTSDVRSSFDKCVSSGQGIRYVISGNGVSGVSLTWQNDTNGTVQGDYQLPFCIRTWIFIQVISYISQLKLLSQHQAREQFSA